MTRLEQLEAAFIKADDAAQLGDQDAATDAKAFAQEIKAERAKAQAPEVQPAPGDYVPDSKGIGTPFMKGATFNLSDEAQGGVAALYAKMHEMVTGGIGTSEITGEKAPSFQQNYETVRDQVRADQDAFEEANPKADLALQLGGGILTGGYGGAKALGTNLAKASPKLALPAVGAMEGAAFGFGEGEGEEDSLQKAGVSAATSAIATPLISKVLDVAGKATQKGLAKIRQRGANNTIEDLKAEAQTFYDAAEASGIKIRPGAWAKFKKNLFGRLKAKGIDVTAQPKTKSEAGLNKSIRRMMASDEPTYKDLAAMRELLDDAKANKNEAVSKWAYGVSDDIDNFIENLTPGNLSAGNAANLAEDLTSAKDYWSRMKQANTLAKAREKAELSEAAVRDGDFDTATRSTNRAIVNPENPRKSRGMEVGTITALKEMILGSGSKNFARMGAEMDPGSATRRGISPALGGGALAIAGLSVVGPAGLAAGLIPLLPPLLGRAFKGIANNITRKEYDKIEHAVLNKNQPDLEELIKQLYSKYKPGVGGVSAAIAGSISADNADLTRSTLEDMISP